MVTGGVDRVITGGVSRGDKWGFLGRQVAVGSSTDADYFSEWVTGDEPLKTLMIGRSSSGDSE